MDGAFQWLSQFINWLAQLIPQWKIVPPTMGGVKFIRGNKVEEIRPGVIWWWPAITEIFITPSARQTEDLRSQTLVTADDKSIVVGGMLIYRVVDMPKFAISSYDGHTTVKEIALTAIHDVICKMSWELLKEEQRSSKLDTKLKNATKDMLAEYGVEVIKVMLTDLSPGRVIRLIQSASTD